jgi:hypothetical protein
MRPPVPLPTVAPFLTLYTPTFRRPQALAQCLESVGRQTAADDLEHLVIPDHVGYGLVAGLYGRMPRYAAAVRGRYVNILCDDDVLASETVVASVRAFADSWHSPEVIIVRVVKGATALPACDPLKEPVCGAVDLTSYIVRGDIWQRHVKDYGLRYEGDFDHALALYRAGYTTAFCDVLWAVGGQSHGRPEMDY